VRVALTGATGFVGSHLFEALRRRGDEVVALVRRPSMAGALRASGCRLVEGDLHDERALETLVAGAEVVFHVAGLVAARRVADFLRVNRDGTAALARAAARAGVSRLVHVSSLAVTGPTVPGRPLAEDAGPGPVSAYGRSKQAGEEALRSSGVPCTIVRPPAVYGPRDRAFLPLFRAAARGIVLLPGDGSQELSLVHAEDLTSALLAAAASAKTVGGTYHAAHPEPTTQSAFAGAVARALGRGVRTLALPAPLVRGVLGLTGSASRALGRAPLLDGDKARELLAPAWTCSSDALRHDAGWEAALPLEPGLKETARSYRVAGWL
jgi:nucleoside-diphosphate-sugar epimerase